MFKKKRIIISNLSETIREVETNEKNKPIKKSKIINEKMNLSIFFHHS